MVVELNFTNELLIENVLFQIKKAKIWMFGEKVEKPKNIFTIVWDIDGECFSLLLWLNVKNYAYGIDCSDLSFRPNLCLSIIPCQLLRSESTTCMLVNKTLVVILWLHTYNPEFASMRTYLLIALGVLALTL